MNELSDEIRYMILYYYRKGKTVIKTCQKLCEIYGENAVNENQVQELFVRFCTGNFDIKDAPRTDRQVTEKADEILQMLEQDRHVSCKEIADTLNINHTTVSNRLKKAGYAKMLDVWVPQELSQINLIDRITISETLLKRNEMKPFLNQIITGDEKWVKYGNMQRKRLWSKADEPAQTILKPGLTTNKVMLCVWWDWQGIVYYELLQPGQTVNSDFYCSQLEHLNEAIKEKRPELANSKEVVFHHDIDRPHISLKTRNKLTELGWEVLLHPAYSPDLAPSDYHLFPALQNYLNDKKLVDRRAAENHLADFFADKPQKFYTDGIMKLTEKWQKVIDNNGQYVLD